MHLLLDTLRFKHIFTILTHISFPSRQTMSVTMACVFVTYPRISTSQTAIPRTIISIQAGSTLCQMKFTIGVFSHVGQSKDEYLMRFASFHTLSIFILRYILKPYNVWYYDFNLRLILNLIRWCFFNGKKCILFTFWRFNKANPCVSLVREDTLLETKNCSFKDIM